LALAVVTMSASCGMTPAQPRVDDVGAISSISSTSDLQTTLVKRHGDPERYCAARQSDVADTRSDGGSLSVGSENIGEGGSQGDLSLGGRSLAVLIVREMMYRACELSLNLNSDADQTIAIYTMFIEKKKEITAIQTESGTSALGQGANSMNPPASAQTSSSNGTSSITTTVSSDDNIEQGAD